MKYRKMNHSILNTKKLLLLVCIMSMVTIVQALSDYESMLTAANEYYNKGDYESAAKKFKIIQEGCDSNYGETTTELADCNCVLKEKFDYKKCTTIAVFDSYLKDYPNGRYIVKDKLKRSELLNTKAKAEKDDMNENCSTIETCQKYMDAYFQVRYVDRIIDNQNHLWAELNEDEAYANCTKESACDDYLKDYSTGRCQGVPR